MAGVFFRLLQGVKTTSIPSFLFPLILLAASINAKHTLNAVCLNQLHTIFNERLRNVDPRHALNMIRAFAINMAMPRAIEDTRGRMTAGPRGTLASEDTRDIPALPDIFGESILDEFFVFYFISPHVHNNRLLNCCIPCLDSKNIPELTSRDKKKHHFETSQR